MTTQPIMQVENDITVSLMAVFEYYQIDQIERLKWQNNLFSTIIRWVHDAGEVNMLLSVNLYWLRQLCQMNLVSRLQSRRASSAAHNKIKHSPCHSAHWWSVAENIPVLLHRGI